MLYFSTVVKVIDDQMLIFDPKEEEQPFFYHGVKQRDFLKRGHKELKFVFDKVCGNDSTNLEVYANSTKSLVDTLMNGYNCSVFAYGATGAGKTFTMIGNSDLHYIVTCVILTLMYNIYRNILQELKNPQE